MVPVGSIQALLAVTRDHVAVARAFAEAVHSWFALLLFLVCRVARDGALAFSIRMIHVLFWQSDEETISKCFGEL